MSARGRSVAILAVKLAVAGGLIAWLLVRGDLDLTAMIRVEDRRSLLVAALLAVLALVPTLIRWPLLVRALGQPMGFGRAIHASLIGVFTNAFLPAGVGIDGTRIALLAPPGSGRSGTLVASLVADRLLGMLALVTLAVGFSTFGLAHRSSTGILIVGVALLAAAGVVTVTFARLLGTPTAAAGALRRWLGEIGQALGHYRQRKATLVGAFALSLVGHGATVLAFVAAFRCYDPAIDPTAAASFAPLVTLAASLPLTPLGLGVADVLASALYSEVGLDQGEEVVMLIRLLGLTVSLLCGLAWLRPVAPEP